MQCKSKCLGAPHFMDTVSFPARVVTTTTNALQICVEILESPLTLLDCLHTFCGSCIKDWFTCQRAASKPYTCPSCRDPVRDTKHNATVTTLLDMYVAANPDKVRTAEEKEEIRKKYTPGETVLINVEQREKSLRERRIEDEDRRLINEVTALSLREAGVGSAEPSREQRRRDGSRSQGSRSQSSRDNSRDQRTGEDRERRRRREAESERRRIRDDITLRPEGIATADRRRRRSDDEARRRHEERSRSEAVRQIEHQSSLRSLISSSDLDSHDMEEEILRQIREEGLLDGIDLENIDVNQEDQISERIAEAFRRRQNETLRQEAARRSGNSTRSGISSARQRTHSSAPESRETSGDESIRATTRRQRTHSRSPSASGEQSRPPQSMRTIHPTHLDVNSSDEGSRRRRRTTSGGRRATAPVPAAELDARPAARSQTDLSNRPQSYHSASSRPLVTESTRSSTNPTVQRLAELPAPEPSLGPRRTSQSSHTPNASPRIPTTMQSEQPQSLAPIAAPNRRRAPPPADIVVPPVSSLAPPTEPTIDRGLVPGPLSPRVPDTSRMSLSDRATAMGNASRPTSSSSPTPKSPTHLYPEPSITCARCAKSHIEYELHYNCGKCAGGNYNICLSCYRAGKGCLHWFGFGYAAWRNWDARTSSGELQPNAEKPHMLTASRYIPPKVTPGGADGRKTLTNDDPQNRLQSGAFCANCLAWANQCYWRCEACNEGDWGFCNDCVNQGKSCTHPLLPLTYKPSESNSPPHTPVSAQEIPASARILTGPGATGVGNFKPLTFDTRCDICRYPIQPSASRYHCFSCVSKIANSPPGDYDVCSTCYSKLVSSRRISAENGPNGWRRCLQGHRMAVLSFDSGHGGECRVIVQDIVGGRGLSQKQSSVQDPSGGDLQLWSWGDGKHADNDGSHVRLVTSDVMKTSPTSSPDLVIERNFPPSGGVGMKALAVWSWYPAEHDELLFPKGAELRECKDVNGDWFHGSYMGKTGLFPSPYIRISDKVI